MAESLFPVRVTITWLTHQGLVRETNEDTIAVGSWLAHESMTAPDQWSGEIGPPLAVVIADGMGGHAGGEIASHFVAQEIASRAAGIQDADSAQAALDEVNSRLYGLMAADQALVGMGSTVVGLVLMKDKVIWFNVGDSRLYRHRNGSLSQVSFDDVPAEPGIETRAAHRRSHAITQAFGGAKSIIRISPHVGMDEFQHQQRWLLCTDGLTDMVDIDAMEICMETPDDVAVLGLAQEAIDAGGHDNISIVIVTVDGRGPSGAGRDHERRGRTVVTSVED